MIPTEILLGRKLKFPFELNREEKFEGNNLKKKTTPADLVKKTEYEKRMNKDKKPLLPFPF